MPWGVTKDSTLDSLKNKSIEVRQAFAKAANKSLEEGKTEEESIFAGLSQVAILERTKQRELKKSQAEQKVRDNHVPEHIRALQEAQELKKQKILEEELAEENALKEQVRKFVGDEYTPPTISKMHFDNNGKLVIKYSDGTEVNSTNSVPEEVINKYISLAIEPTQKSLEPMTILNSLGEPEIVFYSDGEIVTTIVDLEDY